MARWEEMRKILKLRWVRRAAAASFGSFALLSIQMGGIHKSRQQQPPKEKRRNFSSIHLLNVLSSPTPPPWIARKLPWRFHFIVIVAIVKPSLRGPSRSLSLLSSRVHLAAINVAHFVIRGAVESRLCVEWCDGSSSREKGKIVK